MTRIELGLLFFVLITSSCSSDTRRKDQVNPDSEIVNLPDSRQGFEHDSFLLVSSGQSRPFQTVIANNISYQLVLNSKGDTNFVGTSDTSFITSEGYKVGTSLKQIENKYRKNLHKDPGWGYFIKLPSQWSLQFFIGRTGTNHAPVDSTKVAYVFKRY